MAIDVSRLETGSVGKMPPAADAVVRDVPRQAWRPWGRKIKPAEQIFFFTQLSLMIEIGTSLTGALRALGEQNRNVAFKKIIQEMLRDIEEGRQLSDAMLRHQDVFSPLYISLVRAGEAGGFLKDTIDGIVTLQERREALITQLRSTLTYPLILCILGAVVVVFVLIGILPKFVVLFEGRERLLPWSTRMLMALSTSLRSYWWAYTAGGIAAFFSGAAFLRSPLGHAWRDFFFVRMPLISRLSNKILTCQLLRTLGHLMESHVPLIEALDVTQTTFRNRYFTAFVDQIRQNIREGKRLSYTFAGNPYILESVKQMVATGEEVGNLPNVMLRLAKFYDNEIERDLKIIASLVEPAALIVLGGVIGMIVSAVILPIFRIAGAVH